MAFVVGTANELLRNIIRSIDKRTDYSTSVVDGERPGIAVNLTLRKRSATVTIPAEDLEAAAESTIRRSQIRTAIKQAIHRMTFEGVPVASTKMLRGKTTEGGFFRLQQSGNRGGRR